MVRARRAVARESPLTGAQAVAQVCKQPHREYLEPVACRMVPFEAARVAEPADPRCAPALSGLPPDVRDFFASEDNVISLSGKSSIVFSEIEAKYGFFGGTEREDVRYFERLEAEWWWEWHADPRKVSKED